MNEKSLTVFRASNGYLYTNEDRSLIELFTRESEGQALGQLLQRVYSEFDTEDGFTLNIESLFPRRSGPSEGTFIVTKIGEGYTLLSSEQALLCRNSAHLQKLLGEEIINAATTYQEDEAFVINIPQRKPEE